MEILDAFTPDECKAIAGAVLDLNQGLVDRGGFYTFGASAYLDNPLEYPAFANAFNEINADAFGGVHLRLNRIINEHFDLPVVPRMLGVGMPSFHVFDADSNDLCPMPHIDEPYTQVVRFAELEWKDPFSFTIPLRVPAAGTGVDFWEGLTGEQIDACVAIGELPSHTFTPYEIGKLYIHDGKTPHRIARLEPLQDGEFRITLQGHGITTDAGIVVYF